MTNENKFWLDSGYVSRVQRRVQRSFQITLRATHAYICIIFMYVKFMYYSRKSIIAVTLALPLAPIVRHT